MGSSRSSNGHGRNREELRPTPLCSKLSNNLHNKGCTLSDPNDERSRHAMIKRE